MARRPSKSPCPLVGGTQLALNWSATATAPPVADGGSPYAIGRLNVMRARVPAGIDIDFQDQLYVNGEPLVRARIPNGRPWNPLDGFNLTVGQNSTITGAPLSGGVPATFSTCLPPPPFGPPKRPGTPAAPLPSPPPGACSAIVAAVSLLGDIEGDRSIIRSALPYDNAADCERHCHTISCCHGFTYHDESCGPAYAKSCFIITNPVEVWSRAMPSSPGHASGLCTKAPTAPSTKNAAGGALAGSDADCAAASTPPSPCIPAVVVCDGTNATIVNGPLGVRSGSAKALGPVIRVKECFGHKPDLGNSFPHWRAQSYGLVTSDEHREMLQDARQASRPNMMDLSQNFPLWFGGWAGGMLVNASQDPGGGRDLKSLKFDDAESVVVHVMADYEWGGVQFKVANGSGNVERLPNGDTALRFEYGGVAAGAGCVSQRRHWKPVLPGRERRVFGQHRGVALRPSDADAVHRCDRCPGRAGGATPIVTNSGPKVNAAPD